MSFQLTENLCRKLIFCKTCNVECCNEEDEKSVSNNDDESMTNDNNIEMFFSFDYNYILSHDRIVSPFFDMDDIGKFTTDIDGLCIYINDKGAEHIGERKRNIKFTLIWTHNLFNDDVVNIMNIWQDALKHKCSVIFKERRLHHNRFAYLIYEVYPIFSENGFKGMKGIIMRVTKPIWQKFDTKKYIKILNENKSNI
jgi:hypothetical protein